MGQSIDLEHAARKAGYFLPDEEAERKIRDLPHNYPNNEEEGRNQVWLALKTVTGGVVFSQEEISVFLEEYTIEEILTQRLIYGGDIRRPFSSPQESTDDTNTRDAHGRETAFCLSCERTRPVTFGQVTTPTMAATFNFGGPVSLTRVASETETQTFCAVCGYRVYTKAEKRRFKQEQENAKMRWIAIWIFAGAALLILIRLIAYTPN